MNLKEIRIRKGVSREALACSVGYGVSAISNYELGIREPNLDTLKKLASALEVSVDELLADPEPVKETNEL